MSFETVLLSPKTRAALDRVVRRRRHLLAARGMAVVLAATLLAAVLAAMVDHGVVLPDHVRWWLSALVYGVAVVAGLVAVLPFLRVWTRSDAARLVEQALPRFRDRLLAAVELAGDAGSHGSLGSRGFRERLQRLVAEEAESISAGQVLPWRRILRWAWAATAVVALCGSLAATPSLHLREHLLRVLLPAANLPRPSRATLVFRSPIPPEPLLPLGEQVAVSVDLELPEPGFWKTKPPETIQFEVQPMGDAAETGDLRPATLILSRQAEADVTPGRPGHDLSGRSSVYVGQWLAASSEARYRAVSPIGETPWYRLRAVPRPRAGRYRITVTPPDYAGSPPSTIEGESADVSAIVGSRVRWQMQPSRPLADARLIWVGGMPDEADAAIPLTADEDGSWRVELPVRESRRFQLVLVGEEGLESAFPPTVRLTAEEDRPPRLVWVRPAMHEQTVPAASAQAMCVEVFDEFPVMTLEHQVRINRGAWRTAPLAWDAVLDRQQVAWQWSLASIPLLAGDLLESKVVAVDRRGLQGESPVLEWVISESLLTLSSVAAESARRELSVELGRLVKEAENAFPDAVLAVLAAADEEAEASPESRISSRLVEAAAIRQAAGSLARSTTAVRTRMMEAASMDDPVASEELALAAEVLARIEVAELPLVDRAAEAIEASLENGGLGGLPKRVGLVDAARAVRERLAQLDRHFRTLVAQDVLDEAGRRLEAAVSFQEEQTRRPEMIGTEASAREQQLLAAHLRALASGLARDAAFMPGGAARQVLDRRRWADEMAERLERAADQAADHGEPGRDHMAAEQASLLAELVAHRSVHPLHPGLPAEAIRARQELRRMGGSAADVIARAFDHGTAAAPPVADAVPVARRGLAALAIRREIALARGSRDHAEVAADLGTASRGLLAVLDQLPADLEPLTAAFAAATAAVRTLEAGGRLQTAIRWVDRMRVMERDAATAATRRTTVPRLWEAIGEELGEAADAIRQSGLPEDVADRVRSTRWSAAAETVGRKVGPRRWSGDPLITAAAELEDIQADLQREADALAAAMEAARAVLRAMAPSISDLAGNAAQEAGRRHEASRRLAMAAADGQETDPDAVLPAAFDGADQLGTAVGQLEAALVDEAARQDLLDDSQRALAQDADFARELTRSVARRVEMATEAARDAGLSQDDDLMSLANAYQEAEETFSAIAGHFGEWSSPAREALQADRRAMLERMAEAQAADEAARLEESYADAARLGQLAEADPQELLHRLEQELRSNEPMQEALSDIAAGLAADAQATLEFAAERERSLRSDIEQSDGTVRDEKRWFASELGYLAEQADRVARRLGEEAQRQAAAADRPLEQQQLLEAADAIDAVADEARRVPPDAPLPELIDAAFQLESIIEAVPPRLNEIARTMRTASATSRDIPVDEHRRSMGEAAVAAGRWHQQDVRWADQNLQARERRMQEADRLAQDADRRLQQAEARLAETRQRQEGDPGSSSLERQLRQAELEEAEARQGLALANELRARDQERLAEGRRERDEAGARPTDVDASDPHARLAGDLTDQAARQAAAIATQLDDMLARTGWRDRLMGSREQLASSARQQQGITESVADAARALDRAADHERRLEAHARAGQLADAARRVAATSRQEPAAAERVLADAAESAESEGRGERATPEVSREAVEAVSRAAEAVAQRADEIDRLLSTAREAGDDGPGGSSRGSGGSQPSGQNPAEGLLEPVEMARLLDQLDRQLRQPEAGQSGPAGPAAQPSAAAEAVSRRSQELARSLQQQRQGAGSSTASQEMIDPSGSPGKPTGSMASAAGVGQPAGSATGERAGNVRLLETDGRETFIGGWHQLRTQQAADVVESLRSGVSPRYRRQVETYFRELSHRGQSLEPQR